MNEFKSFPKIARLSRDIIITEKIDGTNASVYIGEDGEFLAGSRTRWITPEHDNFGFARWAYDHKEELMLLGPGHHFGEWWGAGIQRKYGQAEKKFSLFNVSRWSPPRGATFPAEVLARDPRTQMMGAPSCCDVVPVLYVGVFSSEAVEKTMGTLLQTGSKAAPGFMDPEGVVIYHLAACVYFKKTFKKDEEGKEGVR